MNEGRKYKVRRELTILSHSVQPDQREQADKWYLELLNGTVKYEDLEKELGLDKTISRD